MTIKYLTLSLLMILSIYFNESFFKEKWDGFGFSYATHLLFANGYFYAADYSNSRVQKFDSNRNSFHSVRYWHGD